MVKGNWVIARRTLSGRIVYLGNTYVPGVRTEQNAMPRADGFYYNRQWVADLRLARRYSDLCRVVKVARDKGGFVLRLESFALPSLLRQAQNRLY